MPAAAAVRFSHAALDRGGRTVLRDVDWEVGRGQRWVILGPNGSGKTSTLLLAGAYDHPTRGTVDVLGHRLGRVDVRQLRLHIGFVSASIAKLLRFELPAADVVMTGKYAALEPWWQEYSDEDRARARSLLADAGFGYTADRSFGVLSEGERQQVQLARALMGDPELVLLDEPNAGLDLGARERLLHRLAALAADPATPPIVLVTHHVEEIPLAFTHALLLREGEVVASGPMREALTSDTLSSCFGLGLKLLEEDGRFACRAV
ncbi:MAG TPA: ATP-binding cassette domain-containing protein [Acidimicrobiales bacterium]|nr:ATP-binding cassette domain-containing protein [Acidimicrobiales bacterium]